MIIDIIRRNRALVDFSIIIMVGVSFPVHAAAETPDQHDFQCITAMTAAAAKSTDTRKVFELAGSSFFAGEIYGRNPQADLNATAEHTPSISVKAADALLIECGKELNRRGAQITAAARHLRAIGR